MYFCYQIFFLYVVVLCSPDVTLIVNQFYFILNFLYRIELQTLCVITIITSFYVLILRLCYVISSLGDGFLDLYNQRVRENYMKMQCPMIFINLGLNIYINYFLIQGKSLLDMNTIVLVSFFSVSIHLYEFLTFVSIFIKSRRVHPVEERRELTELKKITYDEPHCCCICLDDFLEGVNLECGHSFHQACIKQWLESKKVCPLCRIEV